MAALLKASLSVRPLHFSYGWATRFPARCALLMSFFAFSSSIGPPSHLCTTSLRKVSLGQLSNASWMEIFSISFSVRVGSKMTAIVTRADTMICRSCSAMASSRPSSASRCSSSHSSVFSSGSLGTDSRTQVMIILAILVISTA